MVSEYIHMKRIAQKKSFFPADWGQPRGRRALSKIRYAITQNLHIYNPCWKLSVCSAFYLLPPYFSLFLYKLSNLWRSNTNSAKRLLACAQSKAVLLPCLIHYNGITKLFRLTPYIHILLHMCLIHVRYGFEKELALIYHSTHRKRFVFIFRRKFLFRFFDAICRKSEWVRTKNGNIQYFLLGKFSHLFFFPNICMHKESECTILTAHL